MRRPRAARARREQTPAELAIVGRRFVAKAASRLDAHDTTAMRLTDIAAELEIIAAALRQRDG